MHQIELQNENEKVMWRGQISNDRKGFDTLLEKLRTIEGRNNDKVKGIFMNPTGNYHIPLHHFLESNGSRVKLWKIELQKFSTETGLEISVCHFPPGTSKWNKIEHRLFSFITKNWRGKPLVSYEVIVNLIANTRTDKGLKVECSIDRDSYEKGIKISNEEMLKLNIRMDEFHGEWNYTIAPKK